MSLANPSQSLLEVQNLMQAGAVPAARAQLAQILQADPQQAEAK